MSLRERERFLKLSDEKVEDCEPCDVGWLSAWETETNGLMFYMTTDVHKTIEAILAWGRENEDLVGKFYLDTDGKVFVFVQDGKPMEYEKAMMILNNFR